MEYGWSNNKHLWKNAPDEIKNGNWKSITFLQPFNDALIPNKAGIYMFIGIVNNFKNLSLKAPFYIGHSINIKNRINEHNVGRKHGVKILSLELGCEINYLELPFHSVIELINIERYLTDLFGPTLNLINPPSKGVKNNEKIVKAIVKR